MTTLADKLAELPPERRAAVEARVAELGAELPLGPRASCVVRQGDCLEVMATLVPESVDAVICDPPYHLTSIVKRFGSATAAPAKSNGATGVYKRISAGFLGLQWDGGDVAFRPETWAAVRRLLKPGAHLAACGAPRNFHRLAMAIENAGFEIRDCLSWLYGSGMPKRGGQLKPGWEPIVLARKPLVGTEKANMAEFGVGALNTAAAAVPCEPGDEPLKWAAPRGMGFSGGTNLGPCEALTNPTRWPANVVHDGEAFDGAAWQRYFYSAKCSPSERVGKHPTQKPIALMRWLCRLLVPPGGVVLDPFAGTGTTGAAALEEGFDAVLIEREPAYIGDIVARLAPFNAKDCSVTLMGEAVA